MKNKKVISDSVMVTSEFGYDIFIAPSSMLKVNITEKIEEAETWNSQFDATKLGYHIAVTGYKGLEFRPLIKE